MINKISPSVMCVDPFCLPQTLGVLEKNGIEMLHVDVMDGHFVPNFTLGTDYIKALKAHTSLPLDIHLMITDPEQKLDWFAFGEGDMVSVHVESTPHLNKALAAIRARGAKAVAAVNPATPLCMLDGVMEDIDAVLVMTVNPGFAGQKMVPSTLSKIRVLRETLDRNGHRDTEIEADGNVSFENAVRMKDAGANIFVAGTSSVFSACGTLEENIAKMREILT